MSLTEIVSKKVFIATATQGQQWRLMDDFQHW